MLAGFLSGDGYKLREYIRAHTNIYIYIYITNDPIKYS